VHEGGLPDRGLGERQAELEALVALWLAKTSPDLVFAPSPVETHPDHRAVAYALIAVARRGPTDAGAAALFRATVAFFEISQPIRPNFLFDLTPFRDRKEKAILAFPSQAAPHDYSRLVRALNDFRSMTLPAGAASAEAYAVFPGGRLAGSSGVVRDLQPVAPMSPLSLQERIRVLLTGRLS
jgi:LmbE family N-acetylglucosaminyl deacetylase